MSIGIEKIGQIAVVVTDTERATNFYRDMLGLRFLFAAPGGLAFFDCDGVRLMLSPAEKGFERCSSILYFKVRDIESAHQTLAGKGVQFEQGPHLVAKLPDHELWLAFFRDTEGNVLSLMGER